jgi:hypothetical protein
MRIGRIAICSPRGDRGIGWLDGLFMAEILSACSRGKRCEKQNGRRL